jgi:GntR family transcriptional regulator, vanillate catabolism transcriptional regulator
MIQESQKPLRSDDSSQKGRALILLREMILRGDFEPGERLSELSLVARLSISRTPIRLALERLAHEGLLEASASGGFIARAFTIEDVWDAIEVRGVLEGTAARLAAERLSDVSEVERLRQYHREMSVIPALTMETLSRFLELNDGFHAELLRLAKSPMLAWTLERVTCLPFGAPGSLVFTHSQLPGAVGMLKIGQDHHHAIVEAIENRQGTRAENIAREHARLSRRTIEIALSDTQMKNRMPWGALVRQ